jgi:hypothetical protein
MSLIIRIDVDRPYGRRPFLRHVCSRLSSDLYFPRVEHLGYLAELATMLRWLNSWHVRTLVFFRQCTLPSHAVRELLESGEHEIGLHLEDSRSFETFLRERDTLERCVGRTIRMVSKHGSGGHRYGRRHYAPYEPERYIDWIRRAGMNMFLGNLEDPSIEPTMDQGVRVFPSAFWLEPAWRDVKAFPTGWLRTKAQERDVVLLVHPENVLASKELTLDFRALVQGVEGAMSP